MHAAVAEHHGKRRRDDERCEHDGCDGEQPAPRTAVLLRAPQDVVPVRRLVDAWNVAVEHVVHQCTSSSALRSVCRAAFNVAPTVPGLIASASAIAP